jgi:DNA-binding transcriptional regulator YiaG
VTNSAATDALCEVVPAKVRHPNRAKRQRFPVPSWRFREARFSCGLSVEACADLLRISDRTIRNWESGTVRIPYAAYKLMRVLKGGKLLGPEWQDFYVWRGVLHTPEGHRFEAGELSWWSLLVRRASAFSEALAIAGTARAAANGAGATVAPAKPVPAPAKAGQQAAAAMCGASNTAHLSGKQDSQSVAPAWNPADLAVLTPTLKLVVQAWQGGADLRATMRRTQFYCHRRALLPYGIDIKAVVAGGAP